MMNNTRGFTMIELIMVLTIGAIFMIAAVPGYQALIQNSKVVAVINQLSASLNLARMEAIKRGSRVSVCPTGNNTFTACGDNTQWGAGWIVFTDADSNNAIDSVNDRVKITAETPGRTEISSSSDIISFDGSGFASSGAATLTKQAINVLYQLDGECQLCFPL